MKVFLLDISSPGLSEFFPASNPIPWRRTHPPAGGLGGLSGPHCRTEVIVGKAGEGSESESCKFQRTAHHQEQGTAKLGYMTIWLAILLHEDILGSFSDCWDWPATKECHFLVAWWAQDKSICLPKWVCLLDRH